MIFPVSVQLTFVIKHKIILMKIPNVKDFSKPLFKEVDKGKEQEKTFIIYITQGQDKDHLSEGLY